jgi:hypothetical protein
LIRDISLHALVALADLSCISLPKGRAARHGHRQYFPLGKKKRQALGGYPTVASAEGETVVDNQ